MVVKARSIVTWLVVGGATLFFLTSEDPIIRGVRSGLLGMFGEVSTRYDAQVEICVDIAKKHSIAPTSITVNKVESRDFSDSRHVRLFYDAKDSWDKWGKHEIDCVFDKAARQELPVSVRIDKNLLD